MASVEQDITADQTASDEPAQPAKAPDVSKRGSTPLKPSGTLKDLNPLLASRVQSFGREATASHLGANMRCHSDRSAQRALRDVCKKSSDPVKEGAEKRASFGNSKVRAKSGKVRKSPIRSLRNSLYFNKKDLAAALGDGQEEAAEDETSGLSAWQRARSKITAGQRWEHANLNKALRGDMIGTEDPPGSYKMLIRHTGGRTLKSVVRRLAQKLYFLSG